MTEAEEHWNRVYATKQESAVSWFEAFPERSMQMIEAAGAPRSAAIIDVGGGLSRLADALLAEGYGDVTVLDISAEAIARLRARHAGNQAFHAVAADLRNWRPERAYDLWHDRAVLHFMVSEQEQSANRDALRAALRSGGQAIIATFAADGPERCSGLPVRRYATAELDAFLGSEFERREAHVFDHETPAGAVQRFQAARYRRR